jgi:hypothetical protein
MLILYNKFSYASEDWSRDSAVGIRTGYGLDDGWVGVRVAVNILFSTSSRPVLGPT